MFCVHRHISGLFKSRASIGVDLLSVVTQIVSAFYDWYYFATFLYAYFWFGKHLHVCLLAYWCRELVCDKIVWYVQVISLFSEQFY